VACHLDAARADLLAFTAFPKELWRQVWSNPERAAEQRDPAPQRRRRHVFPDRDAIIRLVGAVLAEQHDECATYPRRPGPRPRPTRRTAAGAEHRLQPSRTGGGRSMTAKRAAIRDPHERAALNAALHDTDSGFWDERGVPAPWPDDIDERRPANDQPVTLQPGQQPF
jgi:hypothetical protein